MVQGTQSERYVAVKRFIVGIVLMCTLALTLMPQRTDAQLIPYGGRTVFIFPCLCMPGCFWKIIGVPGSYAGNTFMYCPTTVLYSHYNIFPAAWQLGQAGPWIPCISLVRRGGDWVCRPIGGGFLEIQDGTSGV